MGGTPGYVAPTPGLTPPDFSIWSIPPLEAPLPPGLPASLRYRPPTGRATQMRAAIERQAQLLWAQVPLAPPPQAPQMVPPLCQPLPSSGSQPATPYQQVVQPPSKPKGGESPLTPLLINLWLWVVKTPMVVAGRELKAKVTTPGPPVLPREHVKGPPLG